MDKFWKFIDSSMGRFLCSGIGLLGKLGVAAFMLHCAFFLVQTNKPWVACFAFVLSVSVAVEAVITHTKEP